MTTWQLVLAIGSPIVAAFLAGWAARWGVSRAVGDGIAPFAADLGNLAADLAALGRETRERIARVHARLDEAGTQLGEIGRAVGRVEGGLAGARAAAAAEAQRVASAEARREIGDAIVAHATDCPAAAALSDGRGLVP